MQIIDALTLSEGNYQIAWQLLEKRFSDKRAIVRDRINELLLVQSADKNDSSSLRQAINTVEMQINALSVLGVESSTWDPIIIGLLTSKLDSETLERWEHSETTNELPTKKEILEFMSAHCRARESVQAVQHNAPKLTAKSNNIKYKKERKQTIYSTAHIATDNKSCKMCKKGHPIFLCFKFKQLNSQERINKANELNLCVCCLSEGHKKDSCKYPGCKKCNAKHNTLLHPDNVPTMTNSTVSQNEVPKESSNTVIVMTTRPTGQQPRKTAMLSTALILARDQRGSYQLIRASLDPGAQSNFITKYAAQLLGLPRINLNAIISGLGQETSVARSSLNCIIKSCNSDFSAEVHCLIMKKLTNDLPMSKINLGSWKVPKNIELADPNFNVPSKIDMLLGAEWFFHLMVEGQIKSTLEVPVVQNTVLGWIISGGRNVSHTSSENCFQTTCYFEKTDDLKSLVERFWQIDDLGKCENALSSTEKECLN